MYNSYRFGFDRVYGPESTQEDVYAQSARGAVHNVLQVLGSWVLCCPPREPRCLGVACSQPGPCLVHVNADRTTSACRCRATTPQSLHTVRQARAKRTQWRASAWARCVLPLPAAFPASCAVPYMHLLWHVADGLPSLRCTLLRSVFLTCCRTPLLACCLQARGIIPRAIEDVFGYIQRDTGERCKFLVRASYLQIYNEVRCSADGGDAGTQGRRCSAAERTCGS